MSKSTDRTMWLKRLVLIAVVLAVAIAASMIVELMLQVQFARDLYLQARRHPPHPFLQVLASGAVATNDAGFRGDPIEAKKQPTTFRIFTLGGSTTLGVVNEYEETYPYKLQVLLRQRYPGEDIQVQNAGVPWFSTAHILVNYELRVRPYEPDLVIVFEAINDLYRGFSPAWFAAGPFAPDYSHYLGPYIRFLGPDVDAVAPALRPLGAESLLWRNLKRRLGGEPTPYDYHELNVAKVTALLRPRAVDHFRSLPSYRRYYQRLVHNILSDGHKVIVASQPFLYAPDLSPSDRALLYYPQIFCSEDGFYPTLESMTAGMRQFNAEARALAAAEGVAFLDFEAVVPKTSEYFSDDVHLRAAGNEILARAAFDWIVSQHVIETWRRTRAAASKSQRGGGSRTGS